MPEYVRAFAPGGTFFFTVVTHQRRHILTSTPARQALRKAIERTRLSHPFGINAFVLLPDHLHCIWTLPAEDSDFSTRWRLIKSSFTRQCSLSRCDPTSAGESRQGHGEQGIWQRRFWEHVVRDEEEYAHLCDYIHFNPVKHGHARCPHLWPHSSFARFVSQSLYDANWACACSGQCQTQPGLHGLGHKVGE
jgi:putative transposase